MKFPTKDLFNKCDQIRSLMKNFIFCKVYISILCVNIKKSFN